MPEPDQTEAELGFQKPKSIYEREDEYRRKRLNRIISPERNDAFGMGDKTPDARVRTYADIMREQQLQRELDNTMQNIALKKKQEAAAGEAAVTSTASASAPAAAAGEKRRNRWDQSASEQPCVHHHHCSAQEKKTHVNHTHIDPFALADPVHRRVHFTHCAWHVVHRVPPLPRCMMHAMGEGACVLGGGGTLYIKSVCPHLRRGPAGQGAPCCWLFTFLFSPIFGKLSPSSLFVLQTLCLTLCWSFRSAEYHGFGDG